MLRFTSYRKVMIASAMLALVVALLAANYLVTTYPPDRRAQAQGNQPDDTVELFAPFWEAWDLLHANYVDPLNDDELVKGALSGMVQVVDITPLDIDLPTAAVDPVDETARFEPLWETWRVLHEAYGDALDDNALMEGALSGMVASIGDPHTDYMNPETFASVNNSMNGEYEGIGATVQKNEETGGLELISIFEGSPAEAAGLRPGDQIVRVEGEDITMLSQSEIIALVRGPADTLIRLGILRPNEPEILKFEVRRGKITVPSVSSEILDGNIGYVRLSQFEFNTSQEMRDALEAIDANNLNGLILDLRGNPGGYLTTAIEVGSAYLTEGAVLLERSPNNEIEHKVTGNVEAPDVPMVVLVDQGSASASELIAGALQDHHRATIVGMQTFGKGSVQTWRELSNGGGIRITISRWYTPDGHSVTEVGIQPDVVVPYDPEYELDHEYDNQLEVALEVLNGTYDETAQALETPEAAAVTD